MSTLISIEVDSETAQPFRDASSADRRKLELLLRLRLKEWTSVQSWPLHLIMDEIGREAEAHGLTPDLAGNAGPQHLRDHNAK
jgi:hypothetical protein